MAETRDVVFDELAVSYDAMFSDREPVRWLRQRVRDQLGPYLLKESRILDIGCGTGDDALWFAQQGHTVVATDISAGMLEQLRGKLRDAPEKVRARITIAAFDAAANADIPGQRYDLVTSNFGALNCVQHLRPLLEQVHERLSPGGVVALTIMGPFCIWETVGFALRGQFGKATRRWRGSAQYQLGDVKQAVWYHSAKAVRRAAALVFEVVDVIGIGIFVPSTEFLSVCERHPRVFRCCTTIETQLGGWWPFNRIGDHYLIILKPSKQ